MRKQVILFFSGLFFSGFLLAQQKIDWAKYDSLPFKEDTIQSFNNKFTRDYIIEPILNSNADIELRYYCNDKVLGNKGQIKSVRCYRDSVVIQNVSYFYSRIRVNDNSKNYVEKVSHYPPLYANDSWFVYSVKKTSFYPKDLFNSMFTRLIESGLFVTPDQTSIVEEYSKKGIVIQSPCKGKEDCYDRPVLLEIKAGNRLRNIHLRTLDYYILNINMPEFKLKHILEDFFNSIK